MYYNAFWIIKYFRNYKNIFYFAASYGSFEPSKPDFYLINNWRCVNLWSGLRSTVFRNRENLGCHLTFKRATSAKLGLFETVCQKWNGLAIKPFFCLFEFWILKKKLPFKACSWKNLQYSISSNYFNRFSKIAYIWPF